MEEEKIEELVDNVNKNNRKKINRQELSKKHYNVIIILLLIITCISIGYSYLSSSLKINGSAGVPKMSWDIHFSGLEENSNNNVLASPAPNIINNSKINFVVVLEKPGDKYGFKVDIVNDGTIDAMINSVAIYGLSKEQSKYIDYTVTYMNGSEIQEKDLLKAGQSKTIYLNINYIDFVSNISNTSDLNVNLVFDVNYVQADNSAINRD